MESHDRIQEIIWSCGVDIDQETVDQIVEFVLAALRDAVNGEDESAHDECRLTISLLTTATGAMPQQLFEAVLGLLVDVRDTQSRNGWLLFKIIDSEWETLTQDQRDFLANWLTIHAPSFQEPMALFLASEILGMYFCDDRAMSVFLEMASDPAEAGRISAAHGFGHLVREAGDPALVERALQAITQLEHDSSQEVRMEAEAARRNLANRARRRDI